MPATMEIYAWYSNSNQGNQHIKVIYEWKQKTWNHISILYKISLKIQKDYSVKMSYFDGDQRGDPNNDYNDGDESGRKPFNPLVSFILNVAELSCQIKK